MTVFHFVSHISAIISVDLIVCGCAINRIYVLTVSILRERIKHSSLFIRS